MNSIDDYNMMDIDENNDIEETTFDDVNEIDVDVDSMPERGSIEYIEKAIGMNFDCGWDIQYDDEGRVEVIRFTGATLGGEELKYTVNYNEDGTVNFSDVPGTETYGVLYTINKNDQIIKKVVSDLMGEKETTTYTYNEDGSLLEKITNKREEEVEQFEINNASYEKFEIDEKYLTLIPTDENMLAGTKIVDNGDDTYNACIYDENGQLIAIKWECDEFGGNATGFTKIKYDENGKSINYIYDQDGNLLHND